MLQSGYQSLSRKEATPVALDRICTVSVINQTAYLMTPIDSVLASGDWVQAPVSIAANSNGKSCQAIGAQDTSIGAVGFASYALMLNGVEIGSIVLTFSDPDSGTNQFSTVSSKGINVVTNSLSEGRAIEVILT